MQSEVPFENRRWQPVPGDEGVMVFPVMTKPDVSSSNAYVLDTGGALIMIDSGADPQVAECIVSAVSERAPDRSRPLIALLTHCHVDHCFQLVSGGRLQTLGSIFVGVQESGARAISEGDEVLSVADLLGRTFPRRHVEIELLAAHDRVEGAVRRFTLPGLGEMILTTRLKDDGTGDLLYMQEASLGNFRFWTYSLPGHSPDSIAFRVGNLLFLGDLIFAASPGIAGITGFSKDDLVNSIRHTRALLTSESISLCLTGHGNQIPSAVMDKVLRNLEREAMGITHAGLFDIQRLGEARDHALDIVWEAERVFTTIGGRLIALAYHLEVLGEDEAAARYQTLLETEKIDLFLSEFHRFTEEFREGKRVDIQFLLKAIQILQKIAGVFQADTLDHVMDRTLVRRADRLLTDLLNTIRGFPVSTQKEVIAVGAFVENVIHDVKTLPFSDEDFLASVDNEELFRRELVARIAHMDTVRAMEITVDGAGTGRLVSADTERLADALTAIFEDFSAAGVTHATVTVIPSDNHVHVRITGHGPQELPPMDPSRCRVYARKIREAGGTLEDQESGISSLKIVCRFGLTEV